MLGQQLEREKTIFSFILGMHVLVMFEENKNERIHDIVDKEKKECTIKKKGHDKKGWHMTLTRVARKNVR